MDWIILIIKPNQSKKAEKNLAAQGIKTFFPRILYRQLDKSFERDLFSGYAFARIPDPKKFKAINSTYGVSKILRIQDKMPSLNDQIIEDIKLQVDSCNSNFSLKKKLKVSDQVTIKLDIFKNQPAEIINLIQKKNSQKVLLRLLYSSQTIWLDESLLAPTSRI